MLITDIRQLSGNINITDKKISNFEIRHANKEIGVPTNWENLVNQSYLYILILKVCENQGYKLLSTGVQHQPRFVTNNSIEAILKGFGIPLLSKRVPEHPTLKGYSKEGIYICLNHWLAAKKNVRSDIFKFHGSRHIAQAVLGSVWAKDSPIEKNILDNLISYGRSNIADGHISTYLVSTEELDKIFGIKTNLHKSDLFSVNEQTLINAFIEMLPFEDFKQDKDMTLPELSEGVLKKYSTNQKLLREYKNLISSVISTRINQCYSPYKGKERDKQRKVPIRTHLERIKKDAVEAYSLHPKEIIRLVSNKIYHCTSYKLEEVEKYISEDFQENIDDLVKERLNNHSFFNSLVEVICDYNRIIDLAISENE